LTEVASEGATSERDLDALFFGRLLPSGRGALIESIEVGSIRFALERLNTNDPRVSRASVEESANLLLVRSKEDRADIAEIPVVVHVHLDVAFLDDVLTLSLRLDLHKVQSAFDFLNFMPNPVLELLELRLG